MDSTTYKYILLGAIVIACYFIGHLMRRIHLPSLIGFMFLGLGLGESGLNWMSSDILDHLSFIPEITLGFIAFSIGSELNLSSLKKQGTGIVSIILGESLLAFFIVTIALYIFTRDLPMSILFGSLAPASAPAGTVAVIQECKSKGSLTQALYAVVGFDDGLAIMIFGFAFTIAKNLLQAESSGVSEHFLLSLMSPVKEIAFSLMLGVVAGYFFSIFISKLKNDRDLFVILVGSILLITGISKQFHLSLILTNMVMGFMLSNTQADSLVRRVGGEISNITPLLFILFFAIAGAHLHLSALPALGIIGIIYILGRMIGKFGGAWIGATIGGAEKRIKKYVGLGIQSQAGVAIGLSLIIKHEMTEIQSEHALAIGASIITTITATSIFFEIIGPILTRLALKKAGEIPLSKRCSYRVIKR